MNNQKPKRWAALPFMLSVGISLLSAVVWPDAAAGSDLALIRARVEKQLLNNQVNPSHIERWRNAINDDGSWPDINYKDVSRTGFQNEEHLQRLVRLCRAYKKPGNKFSGNEQLKKTIDIALHYWLVHDFIADNWWSNEIGTPETLVQVLLIMDDELTDKQTARALPIVARASYVYAWGARPSGDRIKIMGIAAKRLLFEKKAKEFGKVIKAIEGEIKFTKGRGMQYDYSFHHRDDKVNNTLAYGRQYANVFAYWAALVAGTKYQFCQKSIQFLVDYYLDGICKMLAYGKYPDPGAENREITRRGALRPYGAATPEALLKTTTYRKEELERIAKIRSGKAIVTPPFSHFFWRSDYFTFQRPGYFTSVRMYSDRNHNMEEPYNGEGLMNHYRGDGTNYISRTGREYEALAPVYDWQKIPGTTIMQRSQMPPPDKIQQRGLTHFVGAVTDGRYGAVGFDFKSPINPLKAKKAWFFFDREYVCLGAGITGDSSLEVLTTLNQCRLHGAVVMSSEGQSRNMPQGLHSLDQVEWVWHDSIGYIFPDAAEVHLSNRPQTGSWHRVNHQTSSSKRKVSEDVFKLWISHGSRPRGAGYQYIVVPAVSKQEIKHEANNSSIQILSNTPAIQAVENKRLNIFEGIFYKPGTLVISDNLKLVMQDPGIIMIKRHNGAITAISVADPSHRLTKIAFLLSTRIEKKDNNFILTAHWDEDDKMSHITLRLPQNVYKGKSVTVNL